MNYSTAIYKVLMSIDIAFENDSPPNETFDLEKIGISYKRLCVILKSLYESGYIDGIAFIECMGNEIPDFKLCGCHLTMDGMLYLENNSTMKQAYRVLKEAKDWIPGF